MSAAWVSETGMLALRAAALLVIPTLLGACGSQPDSPSAAPSTTSPSPAATSPAVITAPGLLVVGASGAELAVSPAGPPSARIRPNVGLVFDALDQGWARVLTPCENQAWVPLKNGSHRSGVRVVIDPGHGGNESGAVGPSGSVEKEVNLDVARRIANLLQKEGVETALTRNDDYRATLVFRAALAEAVRADALVSIHHNAEPDDSSDGPGTETFYQYQSPAAKRLAGLVYEETVAALGRFPAEWMGNADSGAKWRLRRDGKDAYGILRHTHAKSIPAVISEAAFISNLSEEALLKREDFRYAEAQALSKALLRFLRTEDPGSGFTTPYPRRKPAGPGGSRTGCVDPS